MKNELINPIEEIQESFTERVDDTLLGKVQLHLDGDEAEVFKSVFLQIEKDVSDLTTNQPVKDDALIEEASQYGAQYDRRDSLYSDLLKNYIDAYDSKTKWNKVYKCIFFSAAMLVFLGLITTSIVLLFLIAAKKETAISDIALILSGIGGIISAIIILPRIIAEHLFPTTEDKNMIDMVKNMQNNDSNIRSTPMQNKK